VAFQDYIEVRYRILFCRPLGVFKFTNENRATSANEPDEYGKEYWLVNRQEDGTYVNYIESSSLKTIAYSPDF